MAVDALARAIAAGKVPVTAYEMAVKAGYTGTEEQFAQDMGNSGTNAANAAASASAAAASAESVSASAAQIATNTNDISDLKESLSVKTRNILPEQPAESGITVIDLGSDKTFSDGISISFDLVNVQANSSAGFITLIKNDNTNAAVLTMNGMRNMHTGIAYANETEEYRSGRYSTIDYNALSSEISFRYISINKNRLIAGSAVNFVLKSKTTPSDYVPYIEAHDYTLTEDTNPCKIYSALSNILISDSLYANLQNGYYRGGSGTVYKDSGLFMSDIIPAKNGDVLSYSLSCSNNLPVLIVYDANRQIVNSVFGTGYNNIISGTYTFTADGYFSINGVIAKKDDYSIKYNGESFIEKTVYNTILKPTYNLLEKTNVKKGAGEIVLLDLGEDTTFSNGVSISFDCAGAIAASTSAWFIDLRKADNSHQYGLFNQIADYNGKAWDNENGNTGRYAMSKTPAYQRSITFRYVVANYKSSAVTSGTISNFMFSSGTDLLPYVLNKSAIDYEARAKLAENDELPAYWITAIETAKASIITKELSCETCASMFFVTDQHWTSNVQKSTDIIKRMAREVNTDFVINGGDIIASQNGTKLGAANEINAYMSTLADSGLRVMSTVGNHDTNEVPTPVIGTGLSDDNLYNLMMRNQESWMDTGGTILCNFYDNASQKIRYIQFYYNYNNGYSADVANKLTAALESTPENYTIVLISHAYWNGENPAQAAEDYANLILATMDDISATVALWICGHTHADRDTTLISTGGKKLLIVSTSTDAIGQTGSGYTGPTMKRGTTYEQVIDYIQIDTANKNVYYTRIGSGQDRSFSYA